MNPFYFGSAKRRLFGVYEPARTSSGRIRAAVFCYPWGSEYIFAHRSMRQLSVMLAAEGIHTLRFDYYGTGDSGGDMAEAGLQGWDSDIALAIEEIKTITDAPQVSLVGLRFGALLAAKVAVRQPEDVDRLVLWDPVLSGPRYVEELCALSKSTAKHGKAPTPNEVMGFPLTPRIMEALKAEDFAPLRASLPAQTLALASGPPTSYDALTDALGDVLKPPATIEHIPAVPSWIEGWPTNAGVVPFKVMQRITQWLK